MTPTLSSSRAAGSYDVSAAERVANRRVAVLVPLLPLGLVAIVGAVAGAGVAVAGDLALGLVIVAAGIVLGGLLVALGLATSSLRVEHLLGATRVPEGAAPRVENLVAGLCATFGVSHPPLYVVEEPRINLAMVATPTGAVMVVTRGLLDRLGLLELEGVLAHGLAHLRLDAVRRGTLAATLPAMLGNDAVRHRLAGRGRLLRADEVAAVMVRSPLGLAAALERCRTDPKPQSTSLLSSDRFERTRWVWFDPLPNGEGDTTGELDAPSVRAQVLAEW